MHWCYTFCTGVTFFALVLHLNCTALSQSESSNFFLYIINCVICFYLFKYNVPLLPFGAHGSLLCLEDHSNINVYYVLFFNRLLVWTVSIVMKPMLIKTANTDGSGVKVLVNASTFGYFRSSSLTYDYSQERLYWSTWSRSVKTDSVQLSSNKFKN